MVSSVFNLEPEAGQVFALGRGELKVSVTTLFRAGAALCAGYGFRHGRPCFSVLNASCVCRKWPLCMVDQGATGYLSVRPLFPW